MNVRNNEGYPEPSIIVLKYNSTDPGKIPSPESLELGELALGLCKGSEAIWSKNSEGEVINLRTPDTSLYWNNFFKYYESLSEFEKDLESGVIDESSIVYISETRQVWTKGTYFALSEKEILDLISSRVYVFPLETADLSEESSSEEISNVFGDPDSFKALVENLRCNVLIAAIRVGSDRVYAPVTVSTSASDCEFQSVYSIVLEWMYSGKFFKEEISLNDDTKEYSVKRTETSISLPEIEENLDKILDENLELVSPKIDCSWEFYNNGYERISVYPSPDYNNPVVEKGYKVVFKGIYRWEETPGMKSPVSISKDSTWKNLSAPGQDSEQYTSPFISEDTVFKVTLEAPKTGLMTRGDDVIFSNGVLDTTTDTRSVRFGDRIYYGPCPKGREEDFVEYDIRSLSETRIVLDGELYTTTKKISLESDKYYVIGIPKSLGELSGIWGDGFPIMGAFHRLNNLIEVKNAAGIGIYYYVYVSNNPGCFTDVTLEFK